MLDLLLHIHTFQEHSTFAAWLYCVARNNYRSTWRPKLREPESLDLWRDDHVVPSEDFTSRLHQRELIMQALGKLSPLLQQSLLLDGLYGLPHEQIANVLGISAVAVRQRVRRAKQQFRMEYQRINSAEEAAHK